MLFDLLPRDPAGFSKAVVLKKEAQHSSCEECKGGEGAPRTLHMGWRSGTGHSETLFSATCAEVVKFAGRALHSGSLAVSVSVGGQRAGGAPGHASILQAQTCRASSGSQNLTLTVFFGLCGHHNLVSIKPPLIHTALLELFSFQPFLPFGLLFGSVLDEITLLTV